MKNLARDLVVSKPNQVWYTDVTYVKVEKGFCYTAVIMEGYSKKETFKYECMYMSEINILKELKEISKECVEYYNGERIH